MVKGVPNSNVPGANGNMDLLRPVSGHREVPKQVSRSIIRLEMASRRL